MSSATAHVAAARVEQEAVRYSCERCKVESVLPPTGLALEPGGFLHAVLVTIGRSIRPPETGRPTFAEVRAQMMSKLDEDAYQAFTSRFRFCHECRRFVCPKCWNRSWSSCKSCVARAMKHMSPTRRRLRLGLSLAFIAGSILLIAVGFGSVVVIGAAIH
jgi:hypothetical protein